MKSTIIAILDDEERRRLVMKSKLEEISPNADVNFFDNAPDMVEWLEPMLTSLSLISLDHDLGPNHEREGEVFDPGTGRDVVEYLCNCQPICPVIIHTSNTPAAQGMVFALEEAGWQNERVFPSDDMEWISGLWGQAVAGKVGI